MKHQIRKILMGSLGPSDTYTVKELAAMVGNFEDHDTQPRIRQVIRELITEGCPIGSNGRGYYRITRRIELDDYTRDLQNRIDKIMKRMFEVTRAYEKERNDRHLDSSLPLKDRCRYFAVYLAETCSIPYQAVYAMAYRRLYKKHSIDTVKGLPAHYQGSVLNYLDNIGCCQYLYGVLKDLEGVLA